MTSYYNEIDHDAADCLEQLIAEGIIPAGVVDRRSIRDVRAGDVRGFTQCHWFAGCGGWPYAFRLAGWPDEWRAWTGSCPCQPFSVAGNGAGFADDRDLWPVWNRLIGECSPPIIFGEQVAGAALWIDRLYTDLESKDFAVGASDLPAASVGAKHGRPRFWFVANSQRDQQPRQEPCRRPARRMGWQQQSVSWDEPWQSALSRFRVLGDGLRRSVAATDAARNAIVPQVAAEFIGAFMAIGSCDCCDRQSVPVLHFNKDGIGGPETTQCFICQGETDPDPYGELEALSLTSQDRA